MVIATCRRLCLANINGLLTIVPKAFTIKYYYAPPLHLMYCIINRQPSILILISLCSSMLATISQLPEEQMATKRKCFVVKHLLFI